MRKMKIKDDWWIRTRHAERNQSKLSSDERQTFEALANSGEKIKSSFSNCTLKKTEIDYFSKLGEPEIEFLKRFDKAVYGYATTEYRDARTDALANEQCRAMTPSRESKAVSIGEAIELWNKKKSNLKKKGIKVSDFEKTLKAPTKLK